MTENCMSGVSLKSKQRYSSRLQHKKCKRVSPLQHARQGHSHRIMSFNYFSVFAHPHAHVCPWTFHDSYLESSNPQVQKSPSFALIACLQVSWLLFSCSSKHLPKKCTFSRPHPYTTNSLCIFVPVDQMQMVTSCVGHQHGQSRQVAHVWLKFQGYRITQKHAQL
jgi:hypothetical protein